MEFLHVASSMPDDFGGIERYVLYVASEQANRGHTVTVTSPFQSPLSQRLPVEQVSISVRIKYDFAAVSRYIRLFKERKFDGVITHFSPDYLVPAWAAKLAHQHGLILTRHVAAPMRPSRVRAYTRLYQGFVGVSDFVRNRMVEDGLPHSRTLAALSGCPPLTAPASDVEAMRAKLEPAQFTVGIFGRLVENKGHKTLFNAAANLDGCKVHVFGRGPYETHLKSMVEAGRLPVQFHGYVNDVSVAMAAMDVLCVPSTCDEAFGLTVTEAMSLGKAVAASRVGGIPEIITHQADGLLFSASSVVELTECLSFLSVNPVERSRLGDTASATHLERFTVPHMVDRLEDVYSKLLASELQ